MNSKYKILIVICILFLLGICFFVMYIKNSNKENSVEEINDKIIKVINKNDNKIIATVDGSNISEQDVEWTMFFDEELSKKQAKKETVIKKIILLEANKLNTVVNDNFKKFDKDLIEGFKNKEISEDFLKKINKTKDEYILILQEKIEENSIVSQFKSDITSRIIEGSFECEDEKINNKQNKYMETKKKFDDGEVDYDELVDIREKILSEYIEYLVSKYNIEYK